MVVSRLRLAIVLLIALTVPWAARAQVAASMNPSAVAPSEVFELIITVEGTQVETPELPDAPDFAVINPRQPSVGTSTNIVMVQGRVQQSVSRSYTYRLHVDKEGVFTYPPIPVKVGGKVVKTQPLTVTVSKDVRRPTRRRSPFDLFDPFAQAPQSRPEDDAVAFDDSVIFELTTDKTELYVGEPLTVNMMYGHLASNGVGIGGNEPQVEHVQGFYIEGDYEPVNANIQRNNRAYLSKTRKQVWYATAPGTYTIPGIEWPVTVQRFTVRGYDRRTIVKNVPPITLTVKPLPPSPPGYSGIVGNITVSASLPGGEFLQGQGVEFTVRIAGQANPASISAPEIPKLDWAYLSPPEIMPAQAEADKVLKVFHYTFTPLSDGTFELPAITYGYFSPSSGTYETASTKPIPVTVRKAVSAGPLVTVGGPQAANNAEARVLAEIHPIVREAAQLGPVRSGWPMNLLAGVGAPAAYLALFLWHRHRRRLSEDKDFARDYFARSKSQKRLARVRGAADPTEELFHAVAGFVADKLHIEEAGLTSADARRAIAARGLPSDLADTVEKILRACERARYAGAQLSPAEINALVDAAVPAMDALEDALKKGAAS